MKPSDSSDSSSIVAIDAARLALLDPFDLNESKLIDALGTVFEHRVDYADLYFQLTRSEGWSLDEGIVKAGSFSIDQGVGVRAVSGEKTAFSYSDEISVDALDSATKATRTIARAGGGAKKLTKKLKPGKRHDLYQDIDPIIGMGASAKVALLEKVDKMARKKEPLVSQVMASLAAEHDTILVARSDGLIAADVRPLVRLSVSVIVERDGRREQGYSGGGGRFELKELSDELIEHHVSEAVRQAMVNLKSQPAPAGSYPVVLGPGWPGVLLHEAVGHGLEGDFNRKGSSVFSGRVGERVASKGVTVIDDGTIEQRRGSLNIDDEGNPTARNVLIEDGILKGYLQDTLNARLMKTAVTGSGRRESFAHLPMPRMTNTFMLGGKHDARDVVASLDRGLYAVNFGGGQVDITNGKFVFSASEAYWVEKGKIQYPVKGATLIGSGPEAMNQVDMIGDDMKLDPGIGVCGKEGQSVPVGVGQPTLKINGLTIGGTG